MAAEYQKLLELERQVDTQKELVTETYRKLLLEPVGNVDIANPTWNKALVDFRTKLRLSISAHKTKPKDIENLVIAVSKKYDLHKDSMIMALYDVLFNGESTGYFGPNVGFLISDDPGSVASKLESYFDKTKQYYPVKFSQG